MCVMSACWWWGGGVMCERVMILCGGCGDLGAAASISHAVHPSSNTHASHTCITHTRTHLPARRRPGPDPDRGDRQRLGHRRRDRAGHALQHQREAAGFLQGLRLVEDAHGLAGDLGLGAEAAWGVGCGGGWAGWVRVMRGDLGAGWLCVCVLVSV